MNKPAILGGSPVRREMMSYSRQYIDEADIAAVVSVLGSDYLTCGPRITELEEKLRELTGAKHAIACANGTAALHMSCMAAGIAEGDEVITSPLTFAASANAVLYQKGTPVFADVQADTYCLDPEAVAALVNEKTKAVIAVDYTGQPSALDELKSICSRHNLILIEDSAHALGTKYKGQAVGSLADMTTFSFHAVKTVTGGEGGAVLANDESHYQKLRLMREHGITRNPDLLVEKAPRDWHYEQIDLGYNYRMTDIQAALLLSQLEKLPLFAKRRGDITARYNEAFRELPGIALQAENPYAQTVRHLYTIRVLKERLAIGRDEFYDALKAEGIRGNVHYIPVYYHPYYARLGYSRGICPRAERIYEEILTLPLYYGMSDQDVEDVIEAVKKIAIWYAK